MNDHAKSRSVKRFRLSGPSVTLDLRNDALRCDIADIALADRVFAPHYALPLRSTCTVGMAMLRATPANYAMGVSQIVYGEDFAVVDQAAGWAWGYSLHDHYIGYVAAHALGPVTDPTHIVSVAAAPIFSRASIKSAVSRTLSIGSRVAASPDGDFMAVDGGFIHRRHVTALGVQERDAVAVAERLLGAPYLWGGRGDGGVDCSGLVQRAFGLAGVAVPRDSDQQRTLGEEIAPGTPLRRGDLILFPGHVGMMVDDRHLIHANAYWMAVTIEPLATVVERGAVIVARRRIKA